MTSVIDLIRHYQRSIEKSPDDEKRVLRCLEKLHQLGVTVMHLQQTGVGRTVNALRKEPGEVGDAARALVNKWKNMVAEEEDSSDSDDHRPPNHRGRDSPGESDHKNVNQSRHGSRANQSGSETEIGSSKPYTNGDYDMPNKRHREGDYNTFKRAKRQNEEEEVKQKPDINKQKIKTEPSGGLEDGKKEDGNETSSDNDMSDENSQKPYQVKDEPISDEAVNPQSTKSRTYLLDEFAVKKRESKEESRLGSFHASKVKTEPRHKFERDNEKSKSSERESRKDKKETKHSSEKVRILEKDTSMNRHIESSERHRSSEKEKNLSDKRNSDEKHLEKTISKDKHKSSSDKHRSSSHKDKSKDHKSSSSHVEQSKNSDSKSSCKESSGNSNTIHGSSVKERTRDSESHSSRREKKLKGEDNSNKEKSRSSESSSKSKHSEQSASHSYKNKDDKKSRSSDNKHKSSYKALAEDEKLKSDKPSNSLDYKPRPSSSKTTSNVNKEDVPKKKVKILVETVDSDDGIDCESGASFAEALGMVSPTKAKKKGQVRDILTSPSNVSATSSTSNGVPALPASLLAPTTKLAPLPPLEISALPEISPNYRPRPPPRLLPHTSEEQALSYVMSNKNQRTKVFSGNKTYGKLSSLYDLCVAVLQEHIDALEYTGGVPYEILKPVVDRATPEQLFVLEHYNPYLMEDTNHLWQQHCERKFRNKQRHEMETWREMYSRCQEEQEARLKSLTANIKMAQEVRNAPTKQTKMAYVDSVVKPPRNIARKQAIHGTARAAVTSPAARVAALAGAGVVRAGVLPPRAPSAAPVASAAAFKPKKAPLMQKALQFMRGRKR